MADVHPLAQVSPQAELAPDVRIEPGVVVEAGVTVGAGTALLAGTVLHEGARIGEGCRLGPFAVIGGPPMDRNFRGEPSFVEIGDGVTVREFATIHRATGEGKATTVGAQTLVMCYVHLGHNVQVGSGCVLTNLVQLGGHVHIGERAVLGGGVMVHQFARIGPYAMVGGGSSVSSDVLPYAMAQGTPARHFRTNRVGLQRLGMDSQARRRLESALRHLRRKESDLFDELADRHEEVAHIRAFIQTSERGVAGFAGRS